MHSAEPDAIHIEQLELSARIGMTAEERERPQRLSVSITMWPKAQFESLQDDIRRATDYSAVCASTRDFAAARSDKLIETLATALASHLLGMFPLERVRIELRKFVLSDAQHAAATITRTASIG